jgi:hypothetical protein
MMNCEAIQDRLGPFLDEELSAQECSSLDEHLQACPACTAELKRLRAVVDGLRAHREHSEVAAPPRLWPAIERELDRPGAPRTEPRRVLRFLQKPVAAAASVGILVGLGLFLSVWLGQGSPTASAETIDYSVLLDGLPSDIEASFQRFIGYYHGRQIDPAAALESAPGLSFSLPRELPGGYVLDKVYRLQFGTSPGIAARYQGGKEPVFVFFHPPAHREDLGTHTEMPCIIGDRHGHQIAVGPWRLVHFTDPTTCHCVLSVLNVKSQLPAVFAAIAPRFSTPEKGQGQ